MAAAIAVSGGAWTLAGAGAASATGALYVTALTPLENATSPLPGSQGWTITEPSGEANNEGTIEIDDGVTDPASTATASLYTATVSATDHVVAQVPFTTPIPASTLPGSLTGITYRSLVSGGTPVSLNIGAVCGAGGTAPYLSFVYDPASPPSGQWASQDASATAQWRPSHPFPGYPNNFTYSTFSSLASTWAAACPNGLLYNIGFNLGSGNAGSQSWSNGLAFNDPQGSFLYNFGPAPSVAPATGTGYWMVAADGGIFNFGAAGFFQSMGGKHLNEPIVGVAGTPDHQGYWEVASDGGVFAFGDAQFYGSMGGKHLNQPIVGIVSSTDGKGYLLIARDGGGFAFGDYVFAGSMGGKPLNQPVVGGTGF